jgi:coenzyme F420-reducing hydrogenase delta subunit
LEGDCHYLEGNIVAKRRVKTIKKILDMIGLNGERVSMVNLSSAMGTQFANIAREITEKIYKLGPNPLR